MLFARLRPARNRLTLDQPAIILLQVHAVSDIHHGACHPARAEDAEGEDHRVHQSHRAGSRQGKGITGTLL